MSLMIVRATKEVTPNTFPGTPGAGTQFPIRITADNGFEAEPVPEISAVRDMAGSNRIVQEVLGRFTCNGTLRTHWWFSQAKLLIPWAVTLAGSPQSPYSLAFDQAKQLEDGAGTLLYRRFLGSYCRKLSLSGSSAGNNSIIAASFDFSWMSKSDAITVADFPTPALTAYPTDLPVVFQLLAGGLTLGTSRTNFSEFGLDVTNIFDVLYDESRYPQAIRWCGQDVSFRARLRHKSNADRATFEAVTAVAASALAFTDGTNTGTFSFPAGILRSVGDQRPLGAAAYQMVGFDATLDPATGVLVSYVQTP